MRVYLVIMAIVALILGQCMGKFVEEKKSDLTHSMRMLKSYEDL